MGERGPVADGGGFEVGVCAAACMTVSNDELLDGLRAIKEAGTGVRDDGKLMRLGDDDVALIVHRRVEGEARGREQCACGGIVGPKQIDDGAAGMGGDAVLLDCRAEIVSGKTVVRIERASADKHAVVKRENRTSLNLARHRDEPEGRGRLRVEGRERCEQEDGCCEKVPGCAAGESRYVYHSILLCLPGAGGRFR